MLQGLSSAVSAGGGVLPWWRAVAGLVLIASIGCSTPAGTVRLFPTGDFLTEQTREVLDAAPRRVALPRELNRTVQPAHYLEPGDVLLIEPVRAEGRYRVPGDQRVMADGTVDLGGYGRVIVAGLTIEQAERLVEQRVAEVEEEPLGFNVRLMEPAAVYYVLGEVGSPGAYPLVGNETVLDGILMAGGLSSQASPCDILVSRPTPPDSCRVAMPICYRQITQLGDTTTNYQLQPGDRIFVATKEFWDDLAFWRSRKACPLCDQCPAKPCPDPAVADYRNPIGYLPPTPEYTAGSEPLPESQRVPDEAMPELDELPPLPELD